MYSSQWLSTVILIRLITSETTSTCGVYFYLFYSKSNSTVCLCVPYILHCTYAHFNLLTLSLPKLAGRCAIGARHFLGPSFRSTVHSLSLYLSDSRLAPTRFRLNAPFFTVSYLDGKHVFQGFWSDPKTYVFECFWVSPSPPPPSPHVFFNVLGIGQKHMFLLFFF